jgi:hypothetical protein
MENILMLSWPLFSLLALFILAAGLPSVRLRLIMLATFKVNN